MDEGGRAARGEPSRPADTGDPVGAGTPPSGGAESALRALALRLLGPPERYPDAPAPDEVRLFVGELPPGLTVELPLPDGAHLLGSLVRGSQGVSVVLDADLPPEQVLAAYRERLLPAGWSEPGESVAHGGFAFAWGPAASAGGSAHALFCRSARGPALRVHATTGGDAAPTDVRLELQTDARHSPCAPRNRRFGSPVGDVLPPLAAPSGARQRGGGAGGSPDNMYASASLETESDPAALATHYAGQLERGGWSPADAGTDGLSAWSTWRFQNEGEPWRGLFYIFRRPDAPDQYRLHVEAEWAAASGGAAADRGWSTSSSTFSSARPR